MGGIGSKYRSGRNHSINYVRHVTRKTRTDGKLSRARHRWLQVAYQNSHHELVIKVVVILDKGFSLFDLVHVEKLDKSARHEQHNEKLYHHRVDKEKLHTETSLAIRDGVGRVVGGPNGQHKELQRAHQEQRQAAHHNE